MLVSCGCGQMIVTAEETDLEPGPDGKLISTQERLEQVRQREAEAPKSIEIQQQAYQETSLDDVMDSVAVAAVAAARQSGTCRLLYKH